MVQRLLDHAVRAGRRDSAARVTALSSPGGPGTVRGTLLAFEDMDLTGGEQVTTAVVRRARVRVDGATVWLPADPGTYVLSGSVTVLMGANRRPLRVMAPTTVPATGPDGDVPETVTHLPDLIIDEESRRRNAAVGEDLDQARQDLDDGLAEIDRVGSEVVERVGSAEAGVNALGDLLEDVRGRIGRQQWAGLISFEAETFTVWPLGDGMLRLESKTGSVVQNKWVIQNGPTASGRMVDVTIPAAGDWWIELESDGEHGYTIEDLTVTITEDMMDGTYQWGAMVPFAVDSYYGEGLFLRGQPLGEGRVRFTALMPGPVHGWQVGGEHDLGDGPTYTHTFDGPGQPFVRYYAPGAQGDYLWQGSVSITEAMMGPAGEWVPYEMPDIDWSDAELALDQLTAPGGALDPAVLAALYEDVVVAGIAVATEAFIGGNAILEESVQARHVIASESMTAKVAQFLKVYTDMLVVGGMNRLPDPRFEDADLTAARQGRGSSTYFYYVPSTDPDDVRRYGIPVEPGEQYRVSIPITSGHVSMARVEFWNADGNVRRSSTSDLDDAEYADGVLTYVVTVPDGQAYMGPLVYRTTAFTVEPGASVHLMTDSVLLANGAVTSRALNVLSEAAGGGAVSIQPDGIRLWLPGRSTSLPPSAMWTTDGLRFLDNNGDTAAWLDPVEGLVLGEGGQAGSQMTRRGLQVFDENGEAVTQLGRFSTTGMVLTRGGDVTVAIRDDGSMATESLSVDELTVAGTDLMELLGEQHDPTPRGILGDRHFAGERGPYSSEAGVGWIRWMAVPGRRYKITASGEVRDVGAGSGVTLRMRGTHTGNPGAGYPSPSLARPSIGSTPALSGPGAASHWIGFEKTWTWEPDPHGTVEKPTTMLLSMEGVSGSSSVEWGGGHVRVEDVGISPSTNSGWFDNGGSDAPPVEPPSQKVLRSFDFDPLWLKSWQSNGQSPNAISGRAMQGYTPYYQTAGEYRSMIGFESMAGDLGGVPASDIEWIDVRLKNAYAYATTFVLRAHSASSQPGSFSYESANGSVSKRIGPGGTAWVRLPSSMYAGLRTGTLRGISLYAASTSSGYYGWVTTDGLLMRARAWK